MSIEGKIKRAILILKNIRTATLVTTTLVQQSIQMYENASVEYKCKNNTIVVVYKLYTCIILCMKLPTYHPHDTLITVKSIKHFFKRHFLSHIYILINIALHNE